MKTARRKQSPNQSINATLQSASSVIIDGVAYRSVSTRSGIVLTPKVKLGNKRSIDNMNRSFKKAENFRRSSVMSLMVSTSKWFLVREFAGTFMLTKGGNEPIRRGKWMTVAVNSNTESFGRDMRKLGGDLLNSISEVGASLNATESKSKINTSQTAK